MGRRNVGEIAIALPPQARGRELACASFVAEGAIAGSFETSVYQEKPEKRIATTEVALLATGFDAGDLERGVARGVIVGEAVNFARRLAITPANDMTPTHLAAEATRAANDAGLEIDVLDEARARREGMGSFLSVAQGSAQPPAFIVLRYNGDPSSNELLALVGKGITFDSGGISIKPADRMEEMKYDMSGGAGVIATLHALGQLKPKINVVGIVPATENMPGGKATKPGDVIKAMNGKTIEVINTDAEGRLILADALCYAQKLGATKIVDAATLTGACVIALGHAAAAVVTNDDAFAEEFLAAAKPTGERYWPMPYYEEYTAQMKSDIADLKNTGGRAGGTLTAACVSARVRRGDAVDPPRHRGHGLPRQRVRLASQRADGNAGAGLRGARRSTRRRRRSRLGRGSKRAKRRAWSDAPRARLKSNRAVYLSKTRNGAGDARPYEPEKNPAIRRLNAGCDQTPQGQDDLSGSHRLRCAVRKFRRGRRHRRHSGRRQRRKRRARFR